MADPGRWRIAVDTGGTFTDAFAVAPDGTRHLTKLLSSSRLRAKVERTGHVRGQTWLEIDRDFGQEDGFFTGFEISFGTEAASVASWSREARRITLGTETAIAPGGLVDLSCGEEVPVLAARLLVGCGLGDPLPPLELRLATTRGTNALLEDKGSPPVFITTKGFADLLEIGDQRRPELFALRHRKRRLPVREVVEVEGRLDQAGDEVTPFDAGALTGALAGIPPEDRETAAVALLNSYQNPAQEHEVVETLMSLGFRHITCSSSMARSMRILPRAQTAVADAYLAPTLRRFIETVRDGIGGDFLMMTSAGGLVTTGGFNPKDGLLSGPAGGLVGARAAATSCGIGDFIAFDMGGTSTDVARVGEALPYRFEHSVGGASVMAPSLHIETVAAGGGSICAVDASGLRVGPESAGASPGPACYGQGGPLTLTDVNLLLGRLDPSGARIPLDAAASRAAFAALKEAMEHAGLEVPSDQELLEGLLGIAVERMGEAIRGISIREGYDPRSHALVAFGGAGPQHACAVADSLGIETVLIPGDAGVLSACGVAVASREQFASETVLRELAESVASIPNRVAALEAEARSALAGIEGAGVRRRIAELRLRGQEQTIEVELTDPSLLHEQFEKRFEALFGYPPPEGRAIELVALRVSAATEQATPDEESFGAPRTTDQTEVVSNTFFTMVAEPGWEIRDGARGSVILHRSIPASPAAPEQPGDLVALELTRYRLAGIVGEMGSALKRCAISTNVREREDFSCAILDPEGELVINAPHVPVHLGAMGHCVREVCRSISLDPGDIVVTNHPRFGGSHLPDITVITAAFDHQGQPIAYLANRAHHAEVGGTAPGSMPPNARSLEEEGVVIPPTYLARAGEDQTEAVARLLGDARWPTRNLADNLADLQAQAASLKAAATALESLDAPLVGETLRQLRSRAELAARRHIAKLPFSERHAEEQLDDGSTIAVNLLRRGDRLTVDFTGTSPVLDTNLNATPAIVASTVLYVLRLLIDEDLPLNEGLLEPVEIILPRCLLNPDFGTAPERCPPVVGGNVETSQRLADVLIKALELQAGSQGTMNNLLFGNGHFGYYETIGGGSGAGDGYEGSSGLHTHMTNTAITDPEVLEWRYPVRLRQFSIRHGSGGSGRWRGGDGIVREFEFLEPLVLSLLCEHRTHGPFGLAGGSSGSAGRQLLITAEGERPLPGRFSELVGAGSILRMETPGGGGYGAR